MHRSKNNYSLNRLFTYFGVKLKLMKNLLLILLLVSFTTNARALPKGETLAEQINGTWRIKNVQKMQGMVIRTKKYTKDGGDSKAYINRFKGALITFNQDSTVVLVSPNGKRTVEGKWDFIYDTKYRVKTGTGGPSWDNGHTEDELVMTIKFATSRSYNIEGQYKGQQFNVIKVKGKFVLIDPKYMFKFEKIEEEGDKDKDDK